MWSHPSPLPHFFSPPKFLRHRKTFPTFFLSSLVSALVQLFSHKRISFNKKIFGWFFSLIFFYKKIFSKRLERNMKTQKFSWRCLKNHSIMRLFCSRNLFMFLSLSLSPFRCTIRSRWNRLIARIVMVSTKEIYHVKFRGCDLKTQWEYKDFSVHFPIQSRFWLLLLFEREKKRNEIVVDGG